MRPLRLYKYESYSTRSLINLKSQIVYFGSPLGFNDPYDCALGVVFESMSDEEVEAIRGRYLMRPDLPATARKDFQTKDKRELREVLHLAASKGFGDAIERFAKTRGVACFSERNDDLLMWSHYGGKYKGFCLEFDTSSEVFEKVHKVEYVDRMPKLKVSDALLGEAFDFVGTMFCTKAKAWAYEKEWRAIHSLAGTEFVYRGEALTGVYFGPDIDIQALEIICLILSGQNEHVHLWKGSRSTSEFRVNFERIEYTSYIEARAKGLR